MMDRINTSTTSAALRHGETDSSTPEDAALHEDASTKVAVLLIDHEFSKEQASDKAWNSARESMQRAQHEELRCLREAAQSKRDGALLKGAFDIAGSLLDGASAMSQPVPSGVTPGGDKSKIGALLGGGGKLVPKLGEGLAQATYGHDAEKSSIDAKQAGQAADDAKLRMQQQQEQNQRAKGAQASLQNFALDNINRQAEGRRNLIMRG